jgi:hypothetical protein
MIAIPAMAQTTPIDDKNATITNTIGASGEGENQNGKGNANFTGGVWEVNGGGDDIWSTADGMTFVHTALEGDGNITARILEERGGHDDGWARSGIMIREDDTGAAMNAGVFFANDDVTTPRGRALHSHWRFEHEGATVWGGDTGPYTQDGRNPTDGAIGTRYFPLWMRVQRQGNVFTTFRSDDGKVWEQATRAQEIPNFPATARAGIFASAHGGEVFEMSKFDNVSIGKQVLRRGPPSLQAQAADGQVLLTWTGAPDATAYNIYRRLAEEKEFVKLTAEPVKETSYVDMAAVNGKAASYVVTGLVGTEETAGSLQVPATPAPAIKIANRDFFGHSIGTMAPGTQAVGGDGNLVITANGGGIVKSEWGGGRFDGFRYVATQLDGNATMTVQVASLTTTQGDRNNAHGDHINNGIGLMVREGLAPNARFGAVMATFGAGVRVRGRAEADMSADIAEDGTDADNTKLPLFLRIQRQGDVIRGFQSTDGTTFTQVGSDISLAGLKAPVYIGFAASNGFETFTATATIPANSIKIE